MHPLGSWASPRKALTRPLVWAVAGSLLFATAACGSGGESGTAGGTGSGNTKLSAAQQKCVDKADAFIKARGGLLPKSLPTELTPLKEAPPKGLKITQVQAGSIPTGLEHAKNLIKAAGGDRLDRQDGHVSTARSRISIERHCQPSTTPTSSSSTGRITAALQKPIKAAKAKGVLLALGGRTEPPQSIPGVRRRATRWRHVQERGRACCQHVHEDDELPRQCGFFRTSCRTIAEDGSKHGRASSAVSAPTAASPTPTFLTPTWALQPRPTRSCPSCSPVPRSTSPSSPSATLPSVSSRH